MNIQNKLLFFLLFCITQPLLAQLASQKNNTYSNSLKYSFPQKITSENGLSQSYVYSIIQDTEGFVWLATQEGLNRYDGQKLKVYNNPPNDTTGLPHSWISHLMQSQDKTIWISSYSGGLIKYNPFLDQFSKFDHNNEYANTLKSDRIRMTTQAPNGAIWIATDNGLYILENEKITSFEVKTGLKLSGQNIKDIKFSSNKKIYIATYFNGLDIYNISNNTISNIKETKGEFINFIYEDYGKIWLGTKGGLIRLLKSSNAIKIYKNKANDKLSLSHNNVSSILRDSNGALWIATNGGGLNIMIDEVNGHFKRLIHDGNDKNSINHNGVYSLMEDRSGMLWVGTKDGVAICNLRPKPFFVLGKKSLNAMGMNNTQISSVIEDNEGNLWIGNFAGEVIKYNNFNNTHQFISLPIKSVSNIFEDSKHRIWIGSARNGVFLLNDGRISHYLNDDKPNSLSGNSITCFVEDNGGNIWIGTQTGVNKYREQSDDFVSVIYHEDGSGLIESGAYSLLQDNRGRIWVGTWNGLTILDSNNLNILRHIATDANKENWIYKKTKILMLHQDMLGYIWMGTGIGLFKYDEQKDKFEYLSTSDGLPSNANYIVSSDESGNIWMGTGLGLIKYNPLSNEMEIFDSNDGLDIVEYNTQSFYKNNKGRMFFGGINGIVSFMPSKFIQSSYVPKVRFTGLELFNKPYLIDSAVIFKKNITLSYDQNVINFAFTADDYSAPDEIQFAYKLENFDENWNYIGNSRMATYTNVDPGKYLLKIKASNSERKFSDNTTQMSIIVTPPYWATWWAYTLYAILIVGSTVGAYKFRVGMLKRERKKLQEEVALRTKELQKDKETIEKQAQKLKELDNIKTRFFTNISHELRTPLTLTLGPIDRILEGSLGDVNKKISNTLAVAQKNGKGLLKLINEILDISKIEAGQLALNTSIIDISKKLNNLLDIFNSQAADKSITIKTVFDTSEKIYLDEDKFEKIIINLLSNALKYSGEGSEIVIRSYEYNNLVWISIADNGNGIPAKDLPHIFDRYYQSEAHSSIGGTGIGLALVKELVELHAGNISCESKENEGSVFKLSFLKGEKHLASNQILKCYKQKEDDTESTDNNTTNDSIKSSRQIKILIVEDNDDMRNYVSDILSDYHTYSCENGLLALKELEVSKYDLVITDYMMPKMDGYKMASEMKKSKRNKDIPIIFLTAKSDVNTKLDVLELGIDDYIVKPFNHKELQYRVRNVINTKIERVNYIQQNDAEISPEDEDLASSLKSDFDTYILANIDNTQLNVRSLAQQFNMSERSLFRKIKMASGKSPANYLREIRLFEAKKMLENATFETVSEVAFAVGIDNLSYFTKSYKKKYGKLPSDY